MKPNVRKVRHNVAGVDLGSDAFFLALPGAEVLRFSMFTAEMEKAIALLQERKIEAVAMEATGVYWIPLFEMLEKANIEVCLVNGAHVKNVPGRKSDVQDCQWIQELFSLGLLRPAFIPSGEIRTLRCYVRLREEHISLAAMHVNHMQKALDQMNVKLHKVISQVHGVSGMRIIEAILAGERDPEMLANLCDKRIQKNKRERVVQSLHGNYKEEHLFALRQAVQGYHFFQAQMQGCDSQIQAWLERYSTQLPEVAVTTKPKKIRHHKPEVAGLHEHMVRIGQGKDAGQLPGMTNLTWLKLTAETGTDLSAWPTGKHFASWLGLAPKTDQSGNRRRRRRNKSRNRAGQILRECAQSLAESKNHALGAFYRKVRARRGPQIAIVAVARKLALMYYNLLRYGADYVERGVTHYEQQQRERSLRSLHRRAAELGFQLTPAIAA